jgi:hypothetical protein
MPVKMLKNWNAEKLKTPGSKNFCGQTRRYTVALEAQRRRRARIIRTIVGFGLIVAVPVMSVLRVVVSGVVGAGAGK